MGPEAYCICFGMICLGTSSRKPANEAETDQCLVQQPRASQHPGLDMGMGDSKHQVERL